MDRIESTAPSFEEQINSAYERLNILYDQKNRLEEDPAAYKPSLYKEMLGKINEKIAQEEKNISELEGKIAA